MRVSNKQLAFGSIILVAGFVVWFFGSGVYKKIIFDPTDSNLPAGKTMDDRVNKSDLEIVAGNLNIPWAMAELPGGDLLVTERPGNLKRIGSSQQSFEISGVEHRGEGGLLGIALHPNFEQNNKIYLYLTTKTESGLTNRVESYLYKNDNLLENKIIIEGIPGASFHDGGFLAFGSDGKLYITTGDAGEEQNAQKTKSLAGKILRLNDDGTTPKDNPFDNPVYSYGHRNPQGLAWDDQGRLWSSEHGPSGTQSGNDEINLIIKGGNYGWPTIRGQQTRAGMISPVAESGENETWAPGAIVFLNGSLFFSGLRGQSLYQAKIVNSNELKLEAHLRDDYGRLRAVIVGSGGFIYVSTSNRDGRGDVKSNDDKILKINPDFLK